jgi:outer membrane lipopolysaccharide assembly protein LptE/RlpB
MNFGQTMQKFLISAIVVVLSACNSSTNPQDAAPKTESSPTTKALPANESQRNVNAHDTSQSQGGQVVETEKYHLELVTSPEEEGIHLDFFLQTGENHEAVADAKVTAQVQLPNGNQKTLDLTYDAAGKHYAALLPEKAKGEYSMMVRAEVQGETVNGRFKFSQ